MKLFAPTNSWDIREPGSWWGLAGGATTAGVRVDQKTAKRFAAVFTAIRVISETLASLPCNLKEQVDSRTTRNATDHVLYPLFHDQPNPEQDIMSWLDSQVAFQVGWGNAFAEKQRSTLNQPAAFWQIHPSRIPIKNIRRNSANPDDFDYITAGQPGELVYYVNNDDGTQTPIAASDMFHVPGVMTENGVTGQSLIEWGANAIGNAIAAEQHAGAIFRNGAVSNIVLTHPKTLGEDAVKSLRQQWQNRRQGVENHYKPLVLEEGMDAKPIDMNPEATQLLASRQFSVNEIARLFRLPPHLLADLTRSTNNNIEAQGLEFIVYSMLPWIIRWEKAMQRQLLTDEEKKKYRFKFNVNGLLRGDQAARGQFYQVMFNLGAYSPNDILELEDRNPVDGGDQRFIQGNNAVPLDKVAALTQANIDKAKAPPPTPPAGDPNASNQAVLGQISALMERFIVDVELRDAKEEERDRARAEIERLRQERQSAELARLADAVKAVAPKESIDKPVLDAEKEALRSEKDALQSEKWMLSREKVLKNQNEARDRAVLDAAFAVAIHDQIGRLVEMESKWLDRAIEKPTEWVDARGKFYPRFLKYFAANLESFAAHLEPLGILLDLEWGAKKYADQSILDLKTLDPDAADNHHDKLKECVNHFRSRQWTDRAKTLATDMIERGRRLYAERQNKMK